MDIEEDIKKLNKYIELVIDKDYCDCNELNVIIGKHCDGSKNVAYAIKNTLAEREEDKKRIEELEDRCKSHQKLLYEAAEVEKNYIPKQKVKDLKESIVLEPTIVGGRRNAKTLEYGIKLGKIKACEELLEDK